MLQLIKFLHTIIWAFLASMIFYILYAGISGNITKWVWIAIGIVVLEIFALLLNGWVCPLTPIAAKYTHERQDNFDIYLPLWLARNNKIIFSILFIAGVLLVVGRVFIIG